MSYTAAVLADNPQHFFEFEDNPTGGSISNLAVGPGAGTNATILGPSNPPRVTTIIPQSVGEFAYSFGDAGSLNTKNGASTAGYARNGDENRYTVQFWFKTNVTTTGLQPIVVRDDGASGNGGFAIEAPNDSNPTSFRIAINNAGGVQLDTGLTPAQIATPNMYSFVKNGSTITLYTNGVQTDTIGSRPSEAGRTSFPFQIGATLQAHNYTIDGLAFFPKALSLGQIQTHYTIATTPPVSTPTIFSINPTSGPRLTATPITIYGIDFDAGATVDVDGTPCTSIVVNGAGTQITCTVPALGLGTRTLTVTNPGPFTANTTFTYTGITFQETVIGEGGPNTVGFVSTVTRSPMTFHFPALSGLLGHISGFLFKTDLTSDVQSSSVLTTRRPPVVSNLSVSSGSEAGGTQVTITGSQFQNGITVTIGGIPAQVQYISPTQIVIATPAGVGTKNIVLTNPDGGSLTIPNGWTYLKDFGGQALTGTPVAYYRVEEFIGPQAEDSGPNDLHGIYKNEVEFATPGATTAGRAIRLDNVNDHITVPDDNLLDLTGDLTLVGFIKPTDFSQELIVMQKGANYKLFIQQTTGLIGFTQGATTVVSTNPVVTGQWNFVAVRRGPGDVITFFGASGANVGTGTGLATPSANTNSLELGSSAGTASVYELDELIIYGTALTDSQIANIASSAVIQPPPLNDNFIIRGFSEECQRSQTMVGGLKGFQKRQQVSHRISKKFSARLMFAEAEWQDNTDTDRFTLHGLYSTFTPRGRRPR